MSVYIKTLVVGACCLLLTACPADKKVEPTSAGGVTYTGSTAPATITAANAEALAGSAVNGSSGGEVLAGGAIGHSSSINALDLANTLINAGTQNINTSTGVALGAIQTINETINGAASGGSGTATLSGSIDDVTGYGTLTVTFNQYDDGSGTILNGSISNTISATGASITFTSVSIQDATGTSTMGGTIQLVEVLDGAGNISSDTITMDFVVSNSAGGQVRLQNFVVTTTYDTLGLITSDTISGRFYDSVNGYLDITTTSPMLYLPAGSFYPSSGGPIIATGANNTKVRITPVDATNVLVEADTTGDGNYDYSVQKAWSAL